MFGTEASVVTLVYEIFPAGPKELVDKLHVAESRQLVGAHAFSGTEWWIETTDQIARAVRDPVLVEPDRGGPLKRKVLEYRPKYEVAEDNSMAQIGAAAGNDRSRYLPSVL